MEDPRAPRTAVEARSGAGTREAAERVEGAEGWSLEVAGGREELEALREEWNALLEAGSSSSPFLSWEWIHSWWESYGAEDESRRLHVILARAPEGDLRAILPLYLQSFPLRPFRDFQVLRFLGAPHESSEYLDLIAGEAPPEVLRGLYRAARRSGADGMLLTDVLEDSLLLPTLSSWSREEGLALRRRPRNLCPYLPLPGDFPACLAGLSASVRQNFRRRARELEKRGKVVLRRVRDEAEAALAVETLFDLHRRRWISRRERSGFDHLPRKLFHQRFSPRALQADLLRFYLLEVDGSVVAALYCFRHRRRLFYYQAGMDPDWERYSPGLVLLGKAIEACLEEGMVEFDFLRGLERYKLQWTDRVRETHLLELGFTPRGRACFAARAAWFGGKRIVKAARGRLARVGAV